MRKSILLIINLMVILEVFSQNYQIIFSATGESNTIDSVKVTNVTKGTSISLTGSDTLLLAGGNTGIDYPNSGDKESLLLFPNPTLNFTNIKFNLLNASKVKLELIDNIGRIVVSNQEYLDGGTHFFTLSSVKSGVYILRVIADSRTYIGKLISENSSLSNPKIHLISSEINEQIKNTYSFKNSNRGQMEYNNGDRLLLKGFSTIYSTIVSDTPSESKTINFNFLKTTDFNDNNYTTVTIGNQIWFAENLRVTHYRNGDPVQTNISDIEWSNTLNGSYSIYPHDNFEGIYSEDEMLKAYGALYNWYAAADSRELCPAGWRVPVKKDWVEMVEYIRATSEYNDSNLGNALKSCKQVNSPIGGVCAVDQHPRWNANDDHYGKNEFGFSALPSGTRTDGGIFSTIGTHSLFWIAEEMGINSGWRFYMGNNYSNTYMNSWGKNVGYTIRCITDYDPEHPFPKLTTSPVDSIYLITAISGGDVTDDCGYEVVSRGVVWSRFENPTIFIYEGKTIDGNGTGIYESQLSKLTPNSMYHVRAYATSAEGTGYGQNETFTTLESDIPLINTISISSITANSATCGGDIYYNSGSAIASRGIVWNTEEYPTIENNSGMTVDGEGIGIFSSNINNLDPETIYYIRAYATNLDVTVYGQNKLFKTAPANIGEPYQGGILAYIIQPGDAGYVENEARGFIAAPYDQSKGIKWGCVHNFMGAVATELGLGELNTSTISDNCPEPDIAAKLCENLELNGYSDWFLPSKDELYKLFLNQDLIGGFTKTDSYWSSSELDDSDVEPVWGYEYYGYAYCLIFYHGSSMGGYKDNKDRVRAIRYF